MSKRIAFCADGTWDTSDNNTNVYKIFKGMLSIPGVQLPRYDDGVGSNGTEIQKLLGGAMGQGLFQKIKDGYTRIADDYEAGDDIFIFGFSRGAYTARSLAGMIAVCGLPTKPHDPVLVETAFNAYRHKDTRDELLKSLAPYGMFDAKIKMVGVWDTVGSLGIPALVGGVDPLLYGFLDTSLHPDVQNAYHALAIDEKRAEFPASLWGPAAPGQTLEQVYFCGVHCDVGGGYDDDPSTQSALSDITLSWMVSKAQAAGLVFDPEFLAKFPSVNDPKYALDTLHESWNPKWLFPKSRTIAPNAAMANSVGIRCREIPAYRPRNLTLANGMPHSQYGVTTVVAEPQAAEDTVDAKAATNAPRS
jgi:uncharacterized protein (DUF2235 family)